MIFILYGGYNLIYNATHGKGLSVLNLVMCSIGVGMLLLYVVLYLITFFKKKKKEEEEKRVVIEEVKVEEKKEEPKPVEEKKPEPVKQETPRQRSDVVYEKPRVSRSIYDNDSASGFVSKVGYGPVLRLSGNRILDMRTNTYYRIEGNMVKQEGSGPVFEINGRQIRSAFGGYLYEISGSNVNKVFGGFYASFSGNYLTTYDLQEKYELPGSLNIQQQLAIVALLFGAY